MSISLYDATVTNYLQTLNATAGVLEKGKKYCAENSINLDEIVATSLIDDMLPFQYQVISVAHHSMGALKALEAGEFASSTNYGLDYDDLLDLVRQAISVMESVSPETVNGWSGKQLILKDGENEWPFIAENFVSSLSLPNFYFHATTAYDILRMKGVPLGKRDYLGATRWG